MRLRRLPLLLLLGMVAVGGGGAPVTAAPHAKAAAAVVMQGMTFLPARVHVGLGEHVTWTNQDGFTHTVTSDQKFWDSGLVPAGTTFDRAFAVAGTFAYHCKIHSTMHGKVAVPLVASGSPSAGWRLTWAAGALPARRTVDVRVRREGTTTWHAFRSGTTALGGRFDPARPGTWQVRAHETNTRSGASSGWSPVLSLAVS